MSAWIVSKTHIDLLVEAFFKYEVSVSTPLTPDVLGTLLWKENHRSVNYRYQERRKTPPYTHNPLAICYGGHPSTALGLVREVVRSPIVLYKQCHCYQYQSCERPDWERSAAYRYLCALEAALEKSLGLDAEQVRRSPEYDRAPWGID